LLYDHLLKPFSPKINKEQCNGLFYLSQKQLDAGEAPGISAQPAGEL
jgi:hypothetical protein